MGFPFGDLEVNSKPIGVRGPLIDGKSYRGYIEVLLG